MSSTQDWTTRLFYSYIIMEFDITMYERLWHYKYLVHGPELHAELSHSAHTASSSSAAQPGHNAGSDVAQSSGLLHSNLLPV